MASLCQTALDKTANAVSDPTRRAILARLAQGRASISEVAAPFAMTLTGVCKHVRVLERAGLVKRRRHGREKLLELSPAPLKELAHWMHPYEVFWNGRLDRLQAYFSAKEER